MKYAMGICPNCGRKLFFTKDKEGIRCFGCGKFLKIDSQRKKLVL
jgi:DNA-directed RNA polymerase subunit RPC12/RpoP